MEDLQMKFSGIHPFVGLSQIQEKSRTIDPWPLSRTQNRGRMREAVSPRSSGLTQVYPQKSTFPKCYWVLNVY